MGYAWDFSAVWQYRWALLDGLGTTLLMTAWSAVLGLAVGIAAGLALTSKDARVRWPATAAVEFLRAMPLPVALVYLYYVAPAATGIALPSFWTSVLVFGTIFGAFVGDVFRGCVQAIPRAHVDMAAALGMSRAGTLRRVHFPEVVRRSFPALNGMLITLFKLTGLAALINAPELLQAAGLVVSQRPRVFEVYTAVAALYLAVIVPAAWALRKLERSPRFAMEPGNRHD